VHDKDYADYLKRACASLPKGKSIYPIIFPLRNTLRPPKDPELQVGYYCMDTFTPFNQNAYLAARGAVNCALTGADHILDNSHFAGFADEKGEGEGLGFNINYPLPESITAERYRRTLTTALNRIKRFKTEYLVIVLGLDTAKSDPTGTWQLGEQDFFENGRMIGALRLPTLIVQEGGYLTRTLGQNASRFFEGLWSGYKE